MNTTMKRVKTDADFVPWFAAVMKLFSERYPFGEVFAEACDLYSFDAAERNGFTPQEAFDDYHDWVNR